MPFQIELVMSPEDATDEAVILQKASHQSGRIISEFRKLKQSLDARKVPVKVVLLLECYVTGEKPVDTQWQPVHVSLKPNRKAVIVGFGPAGMFAALQLLEQGIQPVVLERGKNVRERRRDLAVLNRNGPLNPDSNYCFGEGGAGTYSDGKLYTRSKKRGDVGKVLEIFIAHGANPEIRYMAHPHIGTNKLPGIVEAIRKTILELGGAVYFEEKVTDIHIHQNKVKGVKTSSGLEIETEQLILATGHSARDIFHLLHEKKVPIEAKPFAMGVRVEHPQHLIDSIQYHCEDRGSYLPPASYSLVEQVAGRGVFSFCMCPGGIIAPAATSDGEIVVNGWSPSKRDGKFANSGMVVAVHAPDWETYKDFGALAAMKYQEVTEQKAWQSVAHNRVAPAQRLLDFIAGKQSTHLPECSYLPGVASVPLNEVLPGDLAFALRNGLKQMGRKMKGYLHPEALLVGVESRTSSPVRIPRDKNTLQHPGIAGLYPCGEGAGFAGGIVSAALDGIACARALAQNESIIRG